MSSASEEERRNKSHKIFILPTGGLRYKVVCTQCGVIIHSNTNAPDIRVKQHLDGTVEPEADLPDRPDWLEVVVRLRYHPDALTPGGEMRCEPETVQDLVEEVDRSMNASHFGGLIELTIL